MPFKRKKERDAARPGRAGRPAQPVQEAPPQPMEDDYDEPLYDETPLPALKWHRRWRKYRWLLWFLVMIPIIYVAVQIFIILAPRMRTEVAMLDVMTDSLEVRGQVVLSSTPVTGGGGPLYYTVPAGQRVAPETEVALVLSDADGVEALDRMAEVDAELDLLAEAQDTVVDGADLEVLLGQMQDGMYQLLGCVENGEYGTLTQARNAVALSANKMQMSTNEADSFVARIEQLNARREMYAARVEVEGIITAPEGGYFAPSPLRDRVQMDYDTASQLAPAQLQKLLAAEPTYYRDDVVGHIITDYKWYFFTVVDAREADRFEPGDKSLQLTFPDAGDAMVPVTVDEVTVDEENGIALLVMFSEYLSPEIMTLRDERAEIVFGERKGIRIDKNAMRLMDVENEDGSVSTFRGVYVQFGNMVYFRKISILVEDEFYMLVGDEYEEGVNEVRLYDTVVVDSGGVELYDRKIL